MIRLLFIFFCLSAPSMAAGASMPKAVREQPVQTLPQWPDFSARQDQSLEILAACEKDEAACGSEEMKRWATMVRDMRSQNRLRQLITVNRWFNRLIYKFDETPAGTMDHWSDTGELLKSRGDCEDFALGKYYTLRLLGFKPEEMIVTMVYDKFNYANHAVLMIYTGGTRYMLDINSDDMEPSEMDYRYKTIYAFNEKTAWFY